MLRLIFLIIPFLIIGCGEKLPPDVKKILKSRCNTCHSYKFYKKVKNNTQENWVLILQRMIQKGAHLSSKEYDILLNYFSKSSR